MPDDPPVSPRLAALARFWAQVDAQGTPPIEPAGDDSGDRRLVALLWKGAAGDILVGGPFGYREPADGRMMRLPGPGAAGPGHA